MEARLGAPAFARSHARMIGVGSRLAVTELIYRTRHAWVQALLNYDGAAVRLSITVTDPKIRFQVSALTGGQLTAELGHSRFADVRTWPEPEGHSLRIGAHNREYAEVDWFGNPANHQHYVLSHNDAGTGTFDFAIGEGGPSWSQDGVLKFDQTIPSSPQSELPAFDGHAVYASRFRAGTTVNTLTILGPGWELADLAEPRGPDSNRVRVLVPDARERRQRSRLKRRWTRRGYGKPDASRSKSCLPQRTTL